MVVGVRYGNSETMRTELKRYVRRMLAEKGQAMHALLACLNDFFFFALFNEYCLSCACLLVRPRNPS
jgi:hypothetical protein